MLSFLPLAKRTFELVLIMMQPNGDAFYSNHIMNQKKFKMHHNLIYSERFKISHEEPLK